MKANKKRKSLDDKDKKDKYRVDDKDDKHDKDKYDNIDDNLNDIHDKNDKNKELILKSQANLLYVLHPKIFSEIDLNNEHNKKYIIPNQHLITCGSDKIIYFICSNLITDENDNTKACNYSWHASVFHITRKGTIGCMICACRKHFNI